MHLRDDLMLCAVEPDALAVIAGGEVPEFAGLIAAEGSLLPPHVAQRSLRLLDSGCSRDWALPFNIVEGRRKVIVGGCGFKGAPVGGVVEVGYGVAPSYRRRGVASWGLRALVQRAAASGEVDSVVAHIVPGNVASEVVAARVGFVAGDLVAAADGELVVCWRHVIVR